MKTIDKSAVMKMAWKIFRSNLVVCKFFSIALKRAWKSIKLDMEIQKILDSRKENHSEVTY